MVNVYISFKNNLSGFSFANLGLFTGFADGVYNAVYSLVILEIFRSSFAVGIYALLEEQHEATKIAFISTSYGGWLDKIGELPFINLPRINASYSQGSVTFTLATTQITDYVIPATDIITYKVYHGLHKKSIVSL